MKKLFLIFQKKVAEYTWNFKMLLKAVEQTGVMPEWYKVMAKMAYLAVRDNISGFNALNTSVVNSNKKQVK